jgi:hypothetical protein
MTVDRSGREITFPDWREATPGTRGHSRSGWTGTIERVVVAGSGSFVRVRWDRNGASGRVITPAYSLTPIE